MKYFESGIIALLYLAHAYIRVMQSQVQNETNEESKIKT
jgi:hypothetical protein